MDFIPFSSLYDATDREREGALAMQASLPSDYVDPSDAVGDDEWAQAVRRDAVDGTDSFADFRYRWDWGMTPAQRASALADTALHRKMAEFADAVAGLAAKPPVDPEEFAVRVAAVRMERARRV